LTSVIFGRIIANDWANRGQFDEGNGSNSSGAAVAGLLAIVALPALAQTATTDLAKKYRGAPGPIAGAGLPFLAVGYGVYWLVKRRRRNAE